MENRLIAKLNDGRAVIGLSNSWPAPGIIEKMCRGWDFVWIDAQHGQHDYRSVLDAVTAAESMGVETVLRVPGHGYGIIGPYADTACSAVMVPMVDNAQQAGLVIDALCFPPLGKRSYGGRRMVDLYGRSYYKSYKQLVIVQIETPEAIDNVDAIACTKGVDMLFFGPDDMKIRLGMDIDTPAFSDNRLLDAMKKMADTAKKAGKYSGCIAVTADNIRVSLDMGYRLIVCGGDVGFIKAGSDIKLDEMRNILKTDKEHV